MKNINKLRFYLLGYKGYIVLTEVIKKYNAEMIDEVIVGTDNDVVNDYSSDIKKLCELYSIKYLSRKDDTQKNDLISIVIGWRWIIDQSRVTNLIVLHDSLLPKYRGFNPLVTSLINGDTQIGVTALFANADFDQGDIICQSSSILSYPIKISDAIEIITRNYCDVVLQIVNKLVCSQKLEHIKQNNDEASYSLWRDDEDYAVVWSLDSKTIRRHIDAVGYPYQGAYSIIENVKIKIEQVEECEDLYIINRQSGKVLYFVDGCPVVVCGSGLLKILKMSNYDDGKEFILKKLRTRFK